MRRPHSHLEAMKTGRQHDPQAGDIDEPEEEVEEDTDAPVEEVVEIKLFRSVIGSRSRPKPELSTYDGSLTIEN